jgi:hypothetical protein
MSSGFGRTTGGSEKDEILLGTILFWRRRLLRGSFSTASSWLFSYESAICSWVASSGRTWKRSWSPKLPEVSSFKDLKIARKSDVTKSYREIPEIS